MACIKILVIFVRILIKFLLNLHSNKSNSQFFHNDTIEIFVLIISGTISGKFSGKLCTGTFIQFSDENFDIKILFFEKYE